MKNKTNFTYKQFIQKLSIPSHNHKQSIRQKSPKSTKNQHHIPLTDYDQSKLFSKNNQLKSPSHQSNFANITFSPSKKVMKENNQPTNKNQYKIMNENSNPKSIINQNNNKYKQKNMNNSSQHLKSVKQNQSKKSYQQYQDQRHMQSCSTFYRGDNQQQNTYDERNFGVNLKLKMKKNTRKSTYNVTDIKSSRSGNLTERVNTQYQCRNNNNDRVSTQYQRVNTQYDREFPSFYQKSIDEPNFVDDYDYEDQGRLWQNLSRPKSISLQSQLKEGQKLQLNQKSNQYAFNRFISEINEILISITRIQDQSLLLEHKIKYIEYLECLKQLKMIKNDYEPYSQSQGSDLVRQLWQELIMGHNINHFIIIVSIVLKVSPLSYLKEEKSKDYHNYVYLQKKYEYFRFTKLELSRLKMNLNSQISFNQSAKQSTPRCTSQKKYKINTQPNEKIGVSRGNISLNTDYDQSIFHNQSVTSPSVRKTSKSPLGTKRSQILYEQAKKRSLQKKIDKSSIDYEYQRNAKQLTFKPKRMCKTKNQHKVSSIMQSDLSPRLIADEEKSINRMIRGRIEKEIKQITIGKGRPYNEKMIQKMKKEKFEQVLKQMQESKIKQINKVKLKVSKTQRMGFDGQQLHDQKIKEKLNPQESLSKMLDLSFQDYTNQDIAEQNVIQGCFMQKDVINSLFPPNQSNGGSGKKAYKNHSQVEQPNNDQVQCENNQFILDIYIGENHCEKLQIRRDASFQQINLEADMFIKKHNLSGEMQEKLKQELIILMRLYDVEKSDQNDDLEKIDENDKLEKIDQNDEEQQYSLLM